MKNYLKNNFEINNWLWFYYFTQLYDFGTTFLFVNWKTGNESNPIVLLYGWPLAILARIVFIIWMTFYLSHLKTRKIYKIMNTIPIFLLIFICNTGVAIDALKIIFKF